MLPVTMSSRPSNFEFLVYFTVVSCVVISTTKAEKYSVNVFHSAAPDNRITRLKYFIYYFKF